MTDPSSIPLPSTPITPSAPKPKRKPRHTPVTAGPADATPLSSRNAEAGPSKQGSIKPLAASDEKDVARPPVGEKKARKPKKPRAEGGEVITIGQSVKGKEVDHTSEWDCVPLAQAEESRIPPIWTRDGRFYITAQNTSIHVHNAAPPHALKTSLAFSPEKAHTRRITALLLSPTDPNHIVTSSEDGTIKIWDLLSQDLVQSVNAGGKVLQMCIGEICGRWEVFVNSALATPPLVSKKKSKKEKSETYRLSHFAYPTSQSPSTHPEILRLGTLSSKPSAIFMSPSSLYLTSLAGNKAYTFLLPSNLSSPLPADFQTQQLKFTTDQPLTCGAFAPADKLASSEDYFATGSANGVIRLWHGIGQAFRNSSEGKKDVHGASTDNEVKLPTTSLHWHAHAVAALAFTPSGSQILSVGEESVLVQWHIGSGKREYIPRLGGKPMISLAIRPASKGQEEEWWTAFADGSVVKVGAGSGKVSNVGQTVKIDPLRQVDGNASYPLTVHPSTSALVFPSSAPGTLQFVDPAQTSLLFDLEVAPSNRVSRRDDKPIVHVAVEHVAFSDPVKGKSEWMATVEGRKGDEWEGGGDVRNLKIWRWDGQRYNVNTQFPKPHGFSEITNLAFSPLNTETSPALPYLLTAATDGSARLWHVRQAKKSEHGKAASKKPPSYELFWAARSSWNYRSLPIHAAAFSPDSTIIALAHGSSSMISLWDAENNVLLRALDSKKDVKDVKHVTFVGETGRWIAAAGVGGVVCWDLLSCEKSMSHQLEKTTSLLSLSSTNTFLTAHTVASSTVISIHDPTSLTPLRTMTVPHILRSLLPLPSTTSRKSGHINFAAVSQSGDLYRLGDDISAGLPLRASLAPVVQTASEKARLSIWQEMFGEHAFLDPSSVDVSTSVAGPSTLDFKTSSKGNTSAMAVYDGPSHTLPPAHILFDGFMQDILARRGKSSLSENNGDDVILYQQEEMEGVENISSGEKKGKERAVGPEEIKELEEFFKGVLGLGGHTKSQSKVNGVSKVNGHTNGADESDEEVNVKSGVNGSSTPTPKKIAQRVEEEEEDRLVGGVSGSGKKGKKRRAPKDLDV